MKREKLSSESADAEDIGTPLEQKISKLALNVVESVLRGKWMQKIKHLRDCLLQTSLCNCPSAVSASVSPVCGSGS